MAEFMDFGGVAQLVLLFWLGWDIGTKKRLNNKCFCWVVDILLSKF
jgi:hypothetical protein